MALLSEMKCSVCQVGDTPLTDSEIHAGLSSLPDWELITENGVKKLSRAFKFYDFLSALKFTHAVGMLAEEQGHHPTLITAWGQVTVIWWTHKINGLHENDLIMAAKTDLLYTPQKKED